MTAPAVAICRFRRMASTSPFNPPPTRRRPTTSRWASIECSASGGLNIETVKYGKISIGAGGLQFTNDQGWGLRLSAAGWSLKWAGNHTLATGPAAGKLYIDGREIVTK